MSRRRWKGIAGYWREWRGAALRGAMLASICAAVRQLILGGQAGSMQEGKRLSAQLPTAFRAVNFRSLRSAARVR